MATTSSITTFDTSLLLNYYNAQLSQTSVNASAGQATATSASTKNSATANDVTPWSTPTPISGTPALDAQILSAKSFINTSAIPVSATTTDAKMEQDNQKLFALYTAINNLSYLAGMARRDGVTDGQRAGYNTRFQSGLAEIQQYIANQDFNLFSVQAQTPSSSVTSSATVATASFNYTGTVVANGNTVTNPLANVTRDDKFTVTVSRGGVDTPVEMDMADVQGDLTMSNVVSYVNQQLSDAGFSTRFKKTLVSGTEDTTSTSKASAQYAIQVVPGGVEQVSLSADATSSLYVSGSSGLTAGTSTQTADSQGRLIKLSNLDDPTAEFSTTMSASNSTGTATSTASSTVVDASGNVYMLGTTTGNIGSQLNQGSQDVYLTKYDSAGNVQWSKLVGSADTANAGSLALNPKGGVVVVGSTTAQLSNTAINNGNQDSFAVSYDANGNQNWTTQLPTLNTNSANAVSVDADGNVYIGGQTKGVLAAGQTNAGGQDAYVTKIDPKGKIVYREQFGTTGSDSVAATATTSDGDLVVASIQNGHAILSKYAGGDATQDPVWTQDLGDLQSGGTIGGLVVKGDQIYLSGTSRNGALNAPVADPSSGGTDAYVMSLTDTGTSANPNYVSYVGTADNETGAGLAVGSDGSIYVTGSTTGTFDGETRSQDKVSNMFVAKLGGDGSIDWTHQYGGMDGQSTGGGIAIDESGSSVLDALGLPKGKVSGVQNSDLTSATTLRPGDFFKIEIDGTAARTFTITIDKGETLNSLVTKINAQFLGKGKASINYSSNGAALKIEVNPGVTAKLLPGTADTVVVPANKSTGMAATVTSGPSDFDALGRLGITPQTLSKPANSSSTASTSSSNAYALGLASSLSISTSTGASSARAQLLSVLSAVQNIYQKSNATTSTATSASSASTAAMSAAMQAYNSKLSADMNLALSILST